MSLDVMIKGELYKTKCICTHCDNEHEIETRDELFWANITHNLNQMAEAAGIYQHLWRPEEIGISKASQLIEPLKAGLSDMKGRPDHYKQFDASNGWGTYKDFIPWIEKYLQACIDYPDGNIYVSR